MYTCTIRLDVRGVLLMRRFHFLAVSAIKTNLVHNWLLKGPLELIRSYWTGEYKLYVFNCRASVKHFVPELSEASEPIKLGGGYCRPGSTASGSSWTHSWNLVELFLTQRFIIIEANRRISFVIHCMEECCVCLGYLKFDPFLVRFFRLPNGMKIFDFCKTTKFSVGIGILIFRFEVSCTVRSRQIVQ